MSGHDSELPAADEASVASTLIVEEQASIRGPMAVALRREGHRVEEAASGRQALVALSQSRFDLVLTDLSLPDLDGAEVLHTAKRTAPGIEVVVMTPVNAMERGLAMVRAGAYDLLMKPFQPDQLIFVARRALERRFLRTRLRALEAKTRDGPPFQDIVGTSRTLTDVLDMVAQIARLDNAVLVSGERGTGKKLVARTLHELSPRRDSPFLTVNCGAIPESLRDYEIFGQEGANPIGSMIAKHGLIEGARRGTIFLDDVAELSPLAQESMLRILQNGDANPSASGAQGGGELDVRLIAGTSRDLEKCVAEGTFNEGLYYRLNVISIRVPSLRERTEDIPLLAQHFLRRTASRLGRGQLAISPRAMALLTAHPWEGNVRELESVVERAVALDRDGVLGLDDLPFNESQQAADRVIERAQSGSLTLSELEREYVLEILTECGGNRKRTAARLGITTATLWRKLKRFEKSG